MTRFRLLALLSLSSNFNPILVCLFQYLRLKHAYTTQAQTLVLVVNSNYCLERVLNAQYTKGIISCLIRQKWEAKVGHITDERWEKLLGLTPQSLSESQRLSQLLLLHRAYRSPAVLYKIGVRSDSCCPRCGIPDAHILHMLWECSAIQTVYEVTLPPPPVVCSGTY